MNYAEAIEEEGLYEPRAWQKAVKSGVFGEQVIEHSRR